MPIDEKEYNGILFDQLSLLEDIEVVAESENAEETLKLLRANADRLSGNYTSSLRWHAEKQKKADRS